METSIDSINQQRQATPRHFLDLESVSAESLRRIISRAAQMKDQRDSENHSKTLAGKTLAMIFEKPSTRTRVSFEVGMLEMGGNVICLNANDLQLGRGETIADTARVLSRYVHCIMMRSNSHQDLLELAEYSSVPIINGLSDISHPCQLMADLLTLREKFEDISKIKVGWVGDGNNMCNSWIIAAAKFGFSINIACPDEMRPRSSAIDFAKKQGVDLLITKAPIDAVRDVDAVVTDTWISMGDENSEQRLQILSPYRVDSELMSYARPGALFLHCLPAHRGEEVTGEVIDGPQSVVWNEAENRLHVQKAILDWCMS